MCMSASGLQVLAWEADEISSGSVSFILQLQKYVYPLPPWNF